MHARDTDEKIATYQRVLLPRHSLILVGLGVCETFDLTRLAAEKAMQVGTDLITLVCFEVMTLCASCLLSNLSVFRTSRSCCA